MFEHDETVFTVSENGTLGVVDTKNFLKRAG